MPDSTFEARLSRVARAYAEDAIRPVDAAVIAATAIRTAERPHPLIGVIPLRSSATAMSLLVALLILSAAIALLVAGRPSAVLPPPAGTLPVVPQSLVREWIGAPRDVPGLGSSALTAMAIDSRGLRLLGDEYSGSQFDSTIVVSGDTLRVTERSADRCAAGDVGTYRWTVSPGGSRLSVTELGDPCAARSVGIEGDWYRRACRFDGACWGPIDAGTYPSQFFAPRLPIGQAPATAFGAVTFTVPDGWAVGDDFTSNLRLVPADLYAQEQAGRLPVVVEKIETWIRPAASRQDAACSATPDPGVERTPTGLTNWLANLPKLESTPVEALTVDGHPGRLIDIAIADDWTGTCPGLETLGPVVPLFAEFLGTLGPVGDAPYVVGIAGESRLRLIVLDLGAGDLVLITIEASDPAEFDRLVAEAMPIVDTFHFN